MSNRLKLLRHAARPVYSLGRSTSDPSGHCAVCGECGNWEKTTIINDDLARTWKISGQLRSGFDERESMFCTHCRNSFRLRQLAECLTYMYGSRTLKDLVSDEKFGKLDIAEINSCGKLHDTLQALPNLKYSEYGSKKSNIPSENLEQLSYNDHSFDLVLTSDTLEHVPDIRKALAEIRRVLKPGGRHVFTVPVIWNRVTNTRDNQEPSYHGAGEPDYLVFSEFGHDIVNIIEECGFRVKLFEVNVVNLNDVAGVFVATKTKDSKA